MYIDSQLLFTGTPTAPAQAITATAASVNVYDTGAYPGSVTGGGYDQGPGGLGPELAVCVITAFNNLTSLDIQFQTSVDNATWTTVYTVNRLLAQLTAGAVIPFPALDGILATKRYLRFNFNVNGTAPTTGSIEAAVVQDLQAWVAEPDLLLNV